MIVHKQNTLFHLLRDNASIFSLEDFEVSTKVLDCLNFRGVHTVNQLLSMTPTELATIRNMGPTSIVAIQQSFLAANQISWEQHTKNV